MRPEVDFQAFRPRNVLGIGESVHIPPKLNSSVVCKPRWRIEYPHRSSITFIMTPRAFSLESICPCEAKWLVVEVLLRAKCPGILAEAVSKSSNLKYFCLLSSMHRSFAYRVADIIVIMQTKTWTRLICKEGKSHFMIPALMDSRWNNEGTSAHW